MSRQRRDDRSTGSKQTLNGLFLFTAGYRIYLISRIKNPISALSPELFFSPPRAESSEMDELINL